MKVDWNGVLNSLIAAFIFSVLGYFYQVFTGKVKISVRSYFKYLYNVLFVVYRCIFRNWQLILGLVLLLGVSYVTFVLVHSIWAIILPFSLALAVILLACYIMRHAVYKEEFTRLNESIKLFSGELGYFSHSPNGPWGKPVECKPLYPTWPKIEGAKWVWIRERPSDQEAQQGQTVYHKIIFSLSLRPGQISVANLVIAVDDVVVIKINSQSVHRVLVGDGVVVLPIAKCLCEGDNTVEMEIQNLPMPGRTGLDNPSGIIYHFEIR